MPILKLSCGHRIVTDVAPMLQYPDDINYVWCPSCRESAFNPRIPLEWNEIVGYSMSPMQDGLPQVMPSEIMRLQPRLKGKPSRIRPFPYTKGRLGTGRR